MKHFKIKALSTVFAMTLVSVTGVANAENVSTNQLLEKTENIQSTGLKPLQQQIKQSIDKQMEALNQQLKQSVNDGGKFKELTAVASKTKHAEKANKATSE